MIANSSSPTPLTDAYVREAVRAGGEALEQAAKMYGTTPGALQAAAEVEKWLQPPSPPQSGPVLVRLSDVEPQPKPVWDVWE